MEINEIPLIKQCIFESFINNIDNNKLINELNDFYLNMKSNTGSSGGLDMAFPIAGPESCRLMNEIKKRVELIAGREMVCREFWMFSMQAGGSVPRHNHKTNHQLHPEEYYSIAYYPACPGDGANLNFIGNFCNTMESAVSVKSEEGKLIIFNSFIDHYTDRHMSESKRICISANYKPVSPDRSLVSDWTRFAKPGVAEDTRLSKFS
jgi:hypothetical protein